MDDVSFGAGASAAGGIAAATAEGGATMLAGPWGSGGAGASGSAATAQVDGVGGSVRGAGIAATGTAGGGGTAEPRVATTELRTPGAPDPERG
jgi:hypothetical protein